MTIEYYIVDAFTARPFGGNPAAVCLLDSWPDDGLLQRIAFENNLSETAFLVKNEGFYALRWFTPAVEVELCGHATLASAFVLFRFFEVMAERLAFETLSGRLTVTREGSRLCMDFPAWRPEPVGAPAALAEALGAAPREVYIAHDVLAVFENEREVSSLAPDFKKLLDVREGLGVVVTAPGGGECDFVSRFFVPKGGIDEDPVTGRAHSMLIPFWSQRLRKPELFARQVSKRGGELWCSDRGERVRIGGEAVLFASGKISV